MKLSTFFATVAVAFAEIVADDVCVSNGQEVSCDAASTQPIVSLIFFSSNFFHVFKFLKIIRFDRAVQKSTVS